MFHFIVRLFLGAIFLLYAFAKLSGMQLMHLSPKGNIQDLDSISLVWYFFGYSPVYSLFLAIGQLVAALLTIWKKTYRIGLPIYFSIAINIAVLDWGFGLPLPATLLATTLALVSAVLMWKERSHYLRLLEPSVPPITHKAPADTRQSL